VLLDVADSTFHSGLHSVVVGNYHLQNYFLRSTESHHLVGYKLICLVHAKESRGFASGGIVGSEQGNRTLASFSVEIR
jgi:hypothetical protein